MSFDLDFLRRHGETTSFADAVRWASGHSFFKHVDENTLAYNNPETGVHFTLDASTHEVNAGEAGSSSSTEIPSYPEGFESAGFSFNINLVRPSFFVYESMPIVADLLTSLKLAVFNPQSPRATDEPGLIASWLEANRVAAIALRGEGTQRLHMPHDKAMCFWRYQKERARLSAQLEAQEIFVPSLFLFRRVGSNEVQTAVTWTPGVRMVIPPSDWSVIVRKKKSWLGTKQELGYVSADELREKLADYLEPFAADTDLLVIPAASMQSVERILSKIELRAGLSAFTRVTADEFTDVDA